MSSADPSAPSEAGEADEGEGAQAELLPCPFCNAGGEELGLSVHPNPPPPDGRAEWGVQCYVCHVETPYYDTRAEVAAAWNRRASALPRPDLAEADGAREALARAIDQELGLALRGANNFRPTSRAYHMADAILSLGFRQESGGGASAEVERLTRERDEARADADRHEDDAWTEEGAVPVRWSTIAERRRLVLSSAEARIAELTDLLREHHRFAQLTLRRTGGAVAKDGPGREFFDRVEAALAPRDEGGSAGAPALVSTAEGEDGRDGD